MRSLPVLSDASEASHVTKGLVRLTMACNERCPFCNVPVESYAVRTPPPEEIARQLEAFLASGERTLTISGGEPTLYRDRLVALVREARSRGVPFVELQTNAVLIDEGYAAELAAAGLTSAFVSLLSDDAALHDTLAGLPGAFEPCLRGIDALLAHGVRVALNPVTASLTAERVPDYVDFVARRLPGVTSISLSAVQPHGRAAQHPELLPDYAVLAPAIREARARAARHGLRMLNPYCGLPLCVGWSDEAGIDASVEANEAELARGATFEAMPGIENQNDKRHGAPCLDCALRTRCGGAWHAYWAHRGGSGLAAPLARVLPWLEGAASAKGQAIVTSIDEASAKSTPTVWLHVPRLAVGDAARIARSRITDLALDTSLDALDAATLRELDALRLAMEPKPPQARVRIAARLTRGTASLQQSHRIARALAALGVELVRFVPKDDDAKSRQRWQVVRDALAIEAPGLRVEIAPAG